MDIRIVDQPQPTTEPITEAREPVEPDKTPQISGEMLVQQVAALFDLKPSEISRYHDKLNTLIDFAKSKTDQHSPEGLKWALRDLSLKIGSPPLGEKLINYLTRYAHLSNESRKVNQELAKYNPEP
jgi:hypothetical protein